MFHRYLSAGAVAVAMLAAGPLQPVVRSEAPSPGKRSSAFKPRAFRRRSTLRQGANEHARVHAPQGFQPVKVTPRPAEAFHYMPDGQSRQVRRANERRYAKAMRTKLPRAA